MIVQRQLIIRFKAIPKNFIAKYISTDNKSEVCLKLANSLIKQWEKQYGVTIDLNYGLPHFALASELDKIFRHHLELCSRNQFVLEDTIVFKQFVQPLNNSVQMKKMYNELPEIDEYKDDEIEYFKKTVEIKGNENEKNT